MSVHENDDPTSAERATTAGSAVSAVSETSGGNPLLVEVVRGDLVECTHHGRVVVTAPDGSVRFALGDVEAPMYARSSLKPLQALAMLRLGLDLDGALLALAAASHGGEPYHLDGVRQILARSDLTLDALQNTPDLPTDEVARDAWLRAGSDASSLTQNCSGKHAAMLRTSVLIGADTATYLSLDHPVQREIAAVVAEQAGGATAPTVDGCGAPLFATPLVGLATAFGRLAAAESGPERRVADAYREFPEYASGTGRLDLALHRAVPGLVGKGGAEACFGLGLADGTGVAVKIDDGHSRALGPVLATVLVALGVENSGLDALLTSPVLGHGEPVGEVRVAASALGRLAG